MYHVGVSNIFELLGDEGEESKRVAAAKAAQQNAAKGTAPVVKETPKKDAAPAKASGKGDDRKPRSEGRPPRAEGPRGEGQGERRRENRGPRGDRPPRDDSAPRRDRPAGDRADRKEGEFRTGPKRVYDRRSGTGRGKEIKKGGGGKGNWGKDTDNWDEVPQEEADKTANPVTGDAPEAAETKVEVVEEAPKELTEEEKKQKEQEEKEAKWLSLEEYQKKKEDSVKALPQLPAPRKAGEGVDKKEAQKWASYQALTRDEEEARSAAEKESQEKKSKKTFVPVNEVLDVRKPRTPKGDRPERGDRPPRGGDRPSRGGDRPPRGGDRPPRGGDRPARGGPRGGQKGGRGGSGGSAPTFVNDANAFPTLSQTATKA